MDACMNILVTGGAGFIGSNLVEYHLNKNDTVIALDDFSTGNQQNIAPFKSNPNFHFIQTDIATFPDLDNVVSQADRIYHMAAIVGVLKIINIPERVLSMNINMTERVLRAARASKRNPRLMLASTSEVYGEGAAVAFDEQADINLGNKKSSCQSYIVSKIATEAYGMAYATQHGLSVTNLRIFNTIGPGQIGGYGMVVPRFIQNAIHHKPLVVHGTGLQIRSFCDVRDLIALMDRLAADPTTVGETFNIGHDRIISILDLAQLIKKLAQSDSSINHISYEEIYGQGFHDIMFRQPNLSKLLTWTDYRFKWNLEASLLDLIERAR